MRERHLAQCLAMLACGVAAPVAAQRAAAAEWSAPLPLSSCPAVAPPQVAFPSASPSDPTGPGAIVWLEAPGRGGCRAGASPSAQPRGLTLSVAPLGPDDLARPPEHVQLDGATAVYASGTGLGRLAVTTLAREPARGEWRAIVLQGTATHELRLAAGLRAPTGRFAATRAYLGDVAVASVQAGPAIAVYVERWFSPRFSRFVRIPIGAGPVTALTVTMDYRSDVLLAWQQDGAVFAHMLRARGQPEPTQLVGPSAPDPQLQALVSDNDHGMIAWSSSEAPGGSGGSTTRVYLARSQRHVRFRSRRLLASFADPAGAGRQPGSLELVRLSNENVLLAWSEVRSGHAVVLAVPAAFAGLRPATLLTPPDGQATLAALAPGASAEAFAIWRQATANGSLAPDWDRAQLWASRAYVGDGGQVGFAPAEMIAPAGSAQDPAVAVDPAGDRAVAVWRSPSGGVLYALGPGSASYAGRAFALPTVPLHKSVHRLRAAAVAALGTTVAMAAGALLLRRRRASDRAD